MTMRMTAIAGTAGPSARREEADRATSLRSGHLAHLFEDGEVLEIGRTDEAPPEATTFRTVLAPRQLQRLTEYRAALQAWFDAVAIGGHLVVTVPHAFLYERRNALPARWHPGQKRLYTPRSLLDEVEEALVPNSYRVRALFDDDTDYDYASSGEIEPTGRSDVVLVIEKIQPPAWKLGAPANLKRDTPDYAFEPSRTRVEVTSTRSSLRIVILKLDHLGDFIMSVGALEKMRALFPGAYISLVVGSWNLELARALGIADEVIPFNVFPRNSSEEEVDVPGQAALFRASITGEYDLAMDMRTDHDTRFLLRSVNARIRAGVGMRAQFPYLDIFLPIDFNRNEPETAREYLFDSHAFSAQNQVIRHSHRYVSSAADVDRFSAVIWGLYRRLRPGRYMFEPFLELDPKGNGLLKLDVSLDAEPVVGAVISSTERVRLEFEVEGGEPHFEFRIWSVPDAPLIDFSFFGGRLIREGAASVLHQSEYQSLLVQLVYDRMTRFGLLDDIAAS